MGRAGPPLIWTFGKLWVSDDDEDNYYQILINLRSKAEEENLQLFKRGIEWLLSYEEDMKKGNFFNIFSIRIDCLQFYQIGQSFTDDENDQIHTDIIYGANIKQYLPDGATVYEVEEWEGLPLELPEINPRHFRISLVNYIQ